MQLTQDVNQRGFFLCVLNLNQTKVFPTKFSQLPPSLKRLRCRRSINHVEKGELFWRHWLLLLLQAKRHVYNRVWSISVYFLKKRMKDYSNLGSFVFIRYNWINQASSKIVIQSATSICTLDLPLSMNQFPFDH